jgi:hypothetical protein
MCGALMIMWLSLAVDQSSQMPIFDHLVRHRDRALHFVGPTLHQFEEGGRQFRMTCGRVLAASSRGVAASSRGVWLTCGRVTTQPRASLGATVAGIRALSTDCFAHQFSEQPPASDGSRNLALVAGALCALISIGASTGCILLAAVEFVACVGKHAMLALSQHASGGARLGGAPLLLHTSGRRMQQVACSSGNTFMSAACQGPMQCLSY